MVTYEMHLGLCGGLRFDPVPELLRDFLLKLERPSLDVACGRNPWRNYFAAACNEGVGNAVEIFCRPNVVESEKPMTQHDGVFREDICNREASLRMSNWKRRGRYTSMGI